jgi:guanine deaminase
MLLRGPILNPHFDGTVELIPDGIIAGDSRITHIGPYEIISKQIDATTAERAIGVICPPFFDNHTHIPQHPVRGRFTEGVAANAPEGRLLAGLNRNIYPAEARCADPQYVWEIARNFHADTLAHGVIGGAAFMTVHTLAARMALELLPITWNLGPVLMNMNCPDFLRIDESTWRQEIEELASNYGRRIILADRFAVCVDSSLRRRGVDVAKRFGLRMQTHLNEQLAEKELVEKKLYPDAGTYTNVYARDGLLDCEPILAHCIWMSPAEFDLIKSKNANVAHCPTSNTLLGSGVMPLYLLHERDIEYSICTDVAASPTTSMLCEMAQFLKVHAGSSKHATPQAALYRATLAPAKILGLHYEFGSFAPGKTISFLDIQCDTSDIEKISVDEFIHDKLLEMPASSQQFADAMQALRTQGLQAGPELSLLEQDVRETVARLDKKVRHVVINGKSEYQARN